MMTTSFVVPSKNRGVEYPVRGDEAVVELPMVDVQRARCSITPESLARMYSSSLICSRLVLSIFLLNCSMLASMLLCCCTNFATTPGKAHSSAKADDRAANTCSGAKEGGCGGIVGLGNIAAR